MKTDADSSMERWFGCFAAAGRFVLGSVLGSALWFVLYMICVRRIGRRLLELSPGEVTAWFWRWEVFLPFALAGGLLFLLGGRGIMRRLFGRWYNDDVPGSG